MLGAKLSRTQLENELRRVDAALARVESGSFGLCCHCGLEVKVDLLEADPATAFCRTCFEELSTRRQGSRR